MSIRIVPPKPSPPPTTERLAVSKKEAAQMLSISERCLDNWRREGKIAVKKAGSRVLVPLESLRTFLNGTESTGDVG